MNAKHVGQAIAFRGLSCFVEARALDRVEKAWPSPPWSGLSARNADILSALTPAWKPALRAGGPLHEQRGSPHFFYEIPRVADPLQQTTQADRLSHPE
jgi:hypothetical protein